jgi:glycosyltransferase 2 family protein
MMPTARIRRHDNPCRVLIGLGGEDREPLIAALLMFRFLYHFLPFVLALGLFGGVEAWRGLRARR